MTILNESVGTFRRQLELTQIKQRAGLALPTDSLLAQTQLDNTTRQLFEARRNREKTEHAIAILVGKTPDQLNLANRALPSTIPAIPPGLPSTLLARRPDVSVAEQNLIAANANIGVAKAQLYPSLNLTSALGFENNTISGLTDWASRLWSLGGNIAAPIFHGGKLKAGVEQAQGAYRELLANYKNSVLNAYREVEDSLTDLHQLSNESTLLEQTVKNAQENVRLIEIQYRQGLVSNLEVLTTAQALLNSRLDAAAVNQQRLSSTVLLIKALGGGWSTSNLPKTEANMTVQQ